MKEETIRFETAKLAKEKGFSPYSNMYYSENGTRFNDEIYRSDLSIKKHGLSECYVNSQSLLQRWLREKHDLNIGLEYFRGKAGSYWVSRIFYKDFKGGQVSYEETLEEALFKALKLI